MASEKIRPNLYVMPVSTTITASCISVAVMGHKRSLGGASCSRAVPALCQTLAWDTRARAWPFLMSFTSFTRSSAVTLQSVLTESYLRDATTQTPHFNRVLRTLHSSYSLLGQVA